MLIKYILVHIYNFIIVIILGIEKSNLKSVWDLLFDKEILARNIPKDTLNKKKVENSEIFSSLMKRTQTSITPYESIGKSRREFIHSIYVFYSYF